MSDSRLTSIQENPISQSSSEPAESPPVSSPKVEAKSKDPVQDIKLQNKDILYLWIVEDNPVNQKILLRVLGQVRAENKETKQNATFKIRMGTGAQAVLDPLRVYSELEDHLALHPDDKSAKLLFDDLDKEFDRIAMIILDNTITSKTIGLTLIKLFRGMGLTDSELSRLAEDGYSKKTIDRIKDIIEKKKFHEKLVASHSNKLEQWDDELAKLVKDYIVDLAKGNFTPKTVIPALKEAKLGAKLEILASPIRDYKVSAAKQSLVFEQVEPCSPVSILPHVAAISDPTPIPASILEEKSPIPSIKTSPSLSEKDPQKEVKKGPTERKQLHIEVPRHPSLVHSGSCSSPESDLSLSAAIASSQISSDHSSLSSGGSSSFSSPATLFSPLSPRSAALIEGGLLQTKDNNSILEPGKRRKLAHKE